MARPGTQEQPTVEEMLVSIRQAIHGENAKNLTPTNSAAPKPPAVSGSMRQMRVNVNPTPKTSFRQNQNSVRTHSDNFQKLKRQLHDLDPLLGKQGRKGAQEHRARTANGFAGILNGDVKLEEALAKLERAGLGDAPTAVAHISAQTPAQAPLAPQAEPETQLRGVDAYADDVDEYDFDDGSYDQPNASHDEYLEGQGELDDTYYEEAPQTPSYIQRAPAAPMSPPVAPPVVAAPPLATAPMAPPPAPRQPSYGYEEPFDDRTLAQPEVPLMQPLAPPVAPPVHEQPVMYQPVAAPRPMTPPVVAEPRALEPVAATPTAALTSPENAQAASDAFASLAETILHQATTGNRSIDDITKELLHPMLKGWLDENLPRMVERLIRQEIERVARGGAMPR